MNEIVSVGVDYGGTWIRIAGINNQKKIIHSLKIPSKPIATLPSLLKNIFKRWKIKELNSLVVCAKGVWKKKPRKTLLEKLKRLRLANNIKVFPDMEIAYQINLGKSPGIVVISGTGSVAYGKDDYGHLARAGGHNPKSGDRGSGKWIGIQYSKTNYRRQSINISTLAKQAIRSAEKGNKESEKIVLKAVDYLTLLVSRIEKKLELGKKIKIGTLGGQFENNYFKNKFKESLKKGLKNHLFQITHPKQSLEIFCASLVI